MTRVTRKFPFERSVIIGISYGERTSCHPRNDGEIPAKGSKARESKREQERARERAKESKREQERARERARESKRERRKNFKSM